MLNSQDICRPTAAVAGGKEAVSLPDDTLTKEWGMETIILSLVFGGSAANLFAKIDKTGPNHVAIVRQNLKEGKVIKNSGSKNDSIKYKYW